jgi:hypothetical protein
MWLNFLFYKLINAVCRFRGKSRQQYPLHLAEIVVYDRFCVNLNIKRSCSAPGDCRKEQDGIVEALLIAEWAR